LIPRPSKSKEHKRNTTGQLSNPDFNLLSLNVPNSTKNKALGDSQRGLPKIIEQSSYPSQQTLNIGSLNTLTQPNMAPKKLDDKSLRRAAHTYLSSLTKSQLLQIDNL